MSTLGEYSRREVKGELTFPLPFYFFPEGVSNPATAQGADSDFSVGLVERGSASNHAHTLWSGLLGILGLSGHKVTEYLTDSLPNGWTEKSESHV